MKGNTSDETRHASRGSLIMVEPGMMMANASQTVYLNLSDPGVDLFILTLSFFFSADLALRLTFSHESDADH